MEGTACFLCSQTRESVTPHSPNPTVAQFHTPKRQNPPTSAALKLEMQGGRGGPGDQAPTLFLCVWLSAAPGNTCHDHPVDPISWPFHGQSSAKVQLCFPRPASLCRPPTGPEPGCGCASDGGKAAPLPALLPPRCFATIKGQAPFCTRVKLFLGSISRPRDPPPRSRGIYILFRSGHKRAGLTACGFPRIQFGAT